MILWGFLYRCVVNTCKIQACNDLWPMKNQSFISFLMQILTGCQRYCLYNKIMTEGQTLWPVTILGHVCNASIRMHIHTLVCIYITYFFILLLLLLIVPRMISAVMVARLPRLFPTWRGHFSPVHDPFTTLASRSHVGSPQASCCNLI